MRPLAAVLLAFQPRAFKLSLRIKAYAEPWNSLVPPLVVTVTEAPPEWPTAAAEVLVTTFTSAMVSMLIHVEQHMFTPLSMLLIPSSFTLMLSLRLPLM